MIHFPQIANTGQAKGFSGRFTQDVIKKCSHPLQAIPSATEPAADCAAADPFADAANVGAFAPATATAAGCRDANAGSARPGGSAPPIMMGP